jgi:glycosyltransferase involved in cell wall biosynthesis
MGKFNILFISHAGSSGGAEMCLFDLISHLNKEEFNVYVNVPVTGELSANLEKASIPYFVNTTQRWIPSKSLWGIMHVVRFITTLRARIWSLETKIQNLNIDLVYTNSLTCIDGALAAYSMQVPHIWHLHENIKGNTSIKSYLPLSLTYFIANKLSSHFISVSNIVASPLHTTIRDNKIDVVHNATSLSSFDNIPSTLIHEELALSKNTRLIAMIGGAPIKGHKIFIEAAQMLLTQKPNRNVAFILIGTFETTYLATLKQYIDSTVAPHLFYFLGQRDNIPDDLRSIYTLVLASESEGFSRVIIEAMAAGRSVVATRCGGPEELVVDGKTGYLVQCNDSATIAHKLIYLLDNPAVAQEMGNCGRKKAETDFTMDRYVDRIKNIIKEVIRQEHGYNDSA